MKARVWAWSAAILLLAGCEQNVQNEPPSDGVHASPGTGLAYEGEVGERILRVVYGEDAGTAVEGSDLSDVLDRLDEIENRLAGGGARYVGSVPNTGAANYQYGGAYGMPAVEAACRDSFGDTAHLCSAEQLIASYRGGDLTANDPAGWVYSTQSQHTDSTYGTTPNSLETSCRGFTYGTADLAHGTIFRVAPVAFKNDGDPAGEHSGPDVPVIQFEDATCNTQGYGFPCCM